MKKLLAILLSMLLLCSMIPFATVSAAGDHYIELVADAEEVNAGEDIAVEVYVYGHESVGLTGAQIELGFDPDVFELVTYYDEDEEAWMPPIEVGPKFSASSNKYILFSPIDEETGYMGRCLVQFLRATASASQAVKTNLFYTATLHVKDDAVSGDYNIEVINHNDKNIVFYGNYAEAWTMEPITITVNGTAAECEHEYEYDCSKNCSKCGEETRPEAEHSYFYACDPVCQICYEITNPEANHSLTHVAAQPATCFENGNIEYWTCEHCGGCWDNENATGMPLNQMSVIVPMGHAELTHVEAVEPTCFENGNIEYWTCEDCGYAWLDAEGIQSTNLLAVTLPMAHAELTHVEAKDPTCYEDGNIEYWTCDDCGYAWLDAEGTLNTNLLAVKLPMAHAEATHVEAVEPTCFENGNIEYWYCADCGQAWLDEACTLNTNLMAVVLPMAHKELTHVAAKDATCTENGNIEYWYCEDCGYAWLDAEGTLSTNLRAVILPSTGHTYDDDLDVDCNVCGEIRVVDYVVKTYGGTSIAESNDGLSGLAFKFDLTDKIQGLAVVEGTKYVADYSNATVTPDSTGTYKLVSMGAKVSNGKQTLNVAVKKIVIEDDATWYAIRIVNIPEDKMDAEITCIPYFVYEDNAGVKHTVYGDEYTACAADIAG